jgi:hypothetical protein
MARSAAAAPAPEFTMPANVDMEKALLGAILLDGAVHPEALAGLRPEYFLPSEHQIIFRRMLAMTEAGRPIDYQLLRAELLAHKELPGIHESGYLSSLTDGTPRRANVEHYVRIIREKAARRHVLHVTEAISGAAPDCDLAELARWFNEAAEQVADYESAGVDLAAFPDPLELPREPEAWIVPGLILKGGITVLAGAPGEGKTWQALAIGRAVAFGSEYLGRQCEQAEVRVLDFENPQSVMQSRWQTIFAGPVKGHVTLWAPWSGMGTVPMLGDSRLTQFAQPGRLLIVDTFSNLHDAKDENSAAEMAPILRQLRALANRGCAILLLHHRGKNELSRYRGSSAIAGGCDIACSLLKDESGLLTLDVFKSRATAEFKLTFRPDYELGRFNVADSPAATGRRDDVTAIAELIAGEPGMSQNRLIEKLGMRRQRATELLHDNMGKLWRIESMGGKRCYYPLATGSQTGSREKQAGTGPLSGSHPDSQRAEPPGTATSSQVPHPLGWEPGTSRDTRGEKLQ